jgi:hypothetical protein
MAEYEEDHLIPLELGGAPADPRNLWPQPRHPADGWTARKKDRLESELHARVCDGKMPLGEAQQAIAHGWTSAYAMYVGGQPSHRVSFTRRDAPPAQPATIKCPNDVAVWVNLNSGVFHFPGTRWYGLTVSGAFKCEREAVAEGDRAARNGQ